jgi:hypothetical protein
VECVEVVVLADVIDPLFDRGAWGGFGGLGDAGGERVQVDIGKRREQRLFVEDGDRLVAGFPERALAVVFIIGESREWLLEGLHDPAESCSRSR